MFSTYHPRLPLFAGIVILYELWAMKPKISRETKANPSLLNDAPKGTELQPFRAAASIIGVGGTVR
jgi:hypothetical protein